MYRFSLDDYINGYIHYYFTNSNIHTDILANYGPRTKMWHNGLYAADRYTSYYSVYCVIDE